MPSDPPRRRIPVVGLVVIATVAGVFLAGPQVGIAPEPHRREPVVDPLPVHRAPLPSPRDLASPSNGTLVPPQSPMAVQPTCHDPGWLLLDSQRRFQLDWEAVTKYKKLSTTLALPIFNLTTARITESFQSFGGGVNYRANFLNDTFSLMRLGLQPGDVVVDVGAHIGTFAMHLLALYPQVTVLAFEPIPRNFRYLVMNLRAAGLLGRVRAINAAVVATPQEDTIAHYAPLYTHHSLTQRIPRNSRTLQYFVPAITLSEVLQHFNISRVAVLKLDCMGCEYDLFDSIPRNSVGLLIGRVHSDYDTLTVSSDKARSIQRDMCRWNMHLKHKKGFGVTGCNEELIGKHAWRADVADVLKQHRKKKLQQPSDTLIPRSSCPKSENLPHSTVLYGFSPRDALQATRSHQLDFERAMAPFVHHYRRQLWGEIELKFVEDPCLWLGMQWFERLEQDLYGLRSKQIGREGSALIIGGDPLGLAAIVIALRNPVSRVFLLQPLPRAVQYTRWNAKLNGVHNRITVIPAALGSEVDASFVHFTYNPFSLQTPRRNFTSEQSTTLVTPAFSLSQAISLTGQDRVAFLLIDCGGCENLVSAASIGKAASVAVEFHSPAPNGTVALFCGARRAPGVVASNCCPGELCRFHARPPADALRFNEALFATLPPADATSFPANVHTLLPAPLPKSRANKPWPNLPSVEILARVYADEEPTLRGYLLPSLSAFWPRRMSTVTLVFDFESPRDRLVASALSRVPPYPRLAFERRPFNYTGVFPIIYQGALRGYGRGYHQQQYSTFFSELYSDADIIAVMDADSIMTTVQTQQSWFDEHGRPIVIGVFNMARKGKAGRWAEATEVALGVPQYADFMVNFPIRIPRDVFPAVRKHMERHHRKPFDKVFYRVATCCQDGYSQFSIILNYAWYHMRDKIAWRFQDTRQDTRPALRTGAHMTQELQFHHASLAIREGYCRATNFSSAACRLGLQRTKVHAQLFRWKNMHAWGSESEQREMHDRHYRSAVDFSFPSEAANYFAYMEPDWG
eukprot:TRINITY_DN21645_c0_g1_i3.p1 TRINITY_DN21645_c0_g1~~TRINITY_DN21645_c0_g1_i3.p1  ORF type:complete len:1026 (-),score=99.72 TRINITY_DN21645_c0_g1_i3:48-3125(-)